MRVAALDHVLLQESELAVVLVDIVVFDAVRQAADDVEMAIPNADPSSAVKNFLSLVRRPTSLRVSVSYSVDPGISIAGWIVKLAEVHSNVELPIVEAEVAVMIGDRNLLQHLHLSNPSSPRLS